MTEKEFVLDYDIELVPVPHYFHEKQYYEQVVIKMDGYPSALVHLDTFYKTHNESSNYFYESLRQGKIIKCKGSFSAFVDETDVH